MDTIMFSTTESHEHFLAQTCREKRRNEMRRRKWETAITSCRFSTSVLETGQYCDEICLCVADFKPFPYYDTSGDREVANPNHNSSSATKLFTLVANGRPAFVFL